jgi:hypothetical protein
VAFRVHHATIRALEEPLMSYPSYPGEGAHPDAPVDPAPYSGAPVTAYAPEFVTQAPAAPAPPPAAQTAFYPATAPTAFPAPPAPAVFPAPPAPAVFSAPPAPAMFSAPPAPPKRRRAAVIVLSISTVLLLITTLAAAGLFAWQYSEAERLGTQARQQSALIADKNKELETVRKDADTALREKGEQTERADEAEERGNALAKCINLIIDAGEAAADQDIAKLEKLEKSLAKACDKAENYL